MNLSEKETSLLARRRKYMQSWPYVGPFLLVVIIGLVVYLNVKAPLLMNPFEVVSRLDSGTLQQSSLEVMAVLLPIMSIVVCFLLVVCVALMYVGLSNEKKYLGMLEKMKKDAPALEKNGDIVKSVG